MTMTFSILLIALPLLLGGLYYVHYKRAGNRFSDSYRWFIKLLK